MKSKLIGALSACLVTGAPVLAAAQDQSTEAEGEQASADVVVDEAAVADALEGVGETPGKTYLFVGARYRNMVIPKFMQNLFADGGESLYAHTPGVEFAIRRDAFEYQLFAQLGLFSMSDVPFKGTSDGDDAWELIDADYQILFLGSDFMWSTDEFAPGFSLTYGAGVGLGIVFGELRRTQAYDSTDPGLTRPTDIDSLERCLGSGQPLAAANYCNPNNNHYGGYVEPSWAEGGSSPLIFPWIAGNFGVRYKAHRNFVAHAELGLMPTGMFLGLGAQYGL